MAKRRKTTPEQVISTSVGIIPGGQPVAAPFSRQAAVKAYSSWVYAAAMINANAIASVPLRLYAKKDAGRKAWSWWHGKPVPPRRKRYIRGDADRQPHATVRKAANQSEDFVEIVDHPAIELLRTVNPWTAGFDHLRLTALYLQATGDAFWYADRTGVGSVPSQLIQLPPQWTEIVPDRGNLIAGYVYGRNRGEAIRLEPDEVVHFKQPNPRNMYYGVGWFEAAWAAINQNNAVHEMDLAFFQNFARPDYLVTVEGNGNEDALERFKVNIEASHQGTKKVGRIMAATGKVSVTPLNFQPKDMNGRDEIVEEISAISGVPVSMLKANDPNLASAEVGFRSWREMTIAPFCRSVEDVLNQLYLPMWDISGDAFFAFDDPVPENAESLSIVMDRKLKNGSMTLNEVRGEDGYDPYEDEMADKPLFNGQPLGMSMSPFGPIGQSPAMPATDAETPEVPDTMDEEPVEMPEQAPQTDAPVPQTETAVQDTALNGAQVTALVDLIVQAREGVIPVDAAEAIAAAAFPLMTPEQLAAIFNPVRSAKPLEKPEEPQQFPKQPEFPEPEKSAIQETIIKQSDFLFGKGCKCHAKATPDPLDDINQRRIRDYLNALEPILRAQGEAIVERLNSIGTPSRDILDAVQAEITNSRWVQQIASASRPYIGENLADGAANGVRLLPPELRDTVRFEFVNPEVTRWVDSATTRVATTVNQTTAMRVRDILGTALEQGKTIPEMTTEVQQRIGVDPARAEMIARTESARAYVQGQQEAWKQSGVVTGKKWLLAPDACEFCRAAARMYNDQPVPLNQPFFRQGETLTGVSGGKMLLDYDNVDGPPLHPNDRCDVVPVLDGER
jgi:HK97 family phage portal protein